MKNTLARIILCAAAIVCTAAWNANAVNLVQNGGFETGDFTGWTHTGDANMFDNVGNDPNFAHSGNFHANLGSYPDFGGLGQSIATVAGTTYTFSFWLAYDVTPDFGDPDASFQALWNGGQVLSITNLTAGGPFDYTLYSFSVLATGASSTIQFNYRHGNDFWRLDDVSVAVPEAASTIWLALPTFAALGLVYSRRGRKGLARA
jgi:Carbohydrate binding domain